VSGRARAEPDGDGRAGTSGRRPRGRGVARRRLAALEEAGRRLGYSVARLDTEPRQHVAQGLCVAAGCTEIGNVNGNPMATYVAERTR
jgi:hypothetical protein